jgi:hypothetical protein
MDSGVLLAAAAGLLCFRQQIDTHRIGDRHQGPGAIGSRGTSRSGAIWSSRWDVY